MYIRVCVVYRWRIVVYTSMCHVQVEKCKVGASFLEAGYVDIYADRHLRVAKLYEGNEYYFRVMAENKVGMSEPATMERPVTAKLPYGQ